MWIESLVVLGLIAINGTLALSEIAIVSARRTRLLRMIETGNAGATRALALAAEPTRFLSTVQVGITTVAILSGAIGEATLAGHVRVMLEQIPGLAAYAEPLALAIVVMGLAYVSLILGELVPKRLALTDPERIASLIARPMQILARLANPIVGVLSASTDAVLRLLHARQVKRAAVTIEEIKVLLEQSMTEGVLEPSEREMMTNVLNLDERRVSSVLTPRSEVVFLDVRDSMEVNRNKLRKEPHDVLPLCDGGLNHVLGVVRTRHVLEAVLAGDSVDLPALAEQALFVPETVTLLKLLEELKRANLPAALVVDEFGDIAGIASLTDVVSSIVGHVPIEGAEEPAIVRRDDGSFLLDGALDLETLERTLDDNTLVSDKNGQHYHTLGGFAMAVLGRVPRTGDTFERGKHRFEVVDMDGNRVDRVLATKLATSTATDGRLRQGYVEPDSDTGESKNDIR